MANDSHHQNRTVTPDFELFSSSECIAWQTVLNIEAVAIVTMNALTFIIFLKERILRKRSMYLVISLAVADMFVTYGLIAVNLALGNYCNGWKINVWSMFSIILRYFFQLASVANLAAISLERLHATFRPFKHRLIKKKIFGAAVAGVWFTAALFTALVFSPYLVGSFFQTEASYYTLLFSCLLLIVVSYTSIAAKFYSGTRPQHHGAIKGERKLTKTLFIVTSNFKMKFPVPIKLTSCNFSSFFFYVM